MAIFTALLLGAAAAAAAPPAHVPTRAVTAAQATVRILKPARVSLSAKLQPDNHQQHKATIIAEDGSRQPALLVEFQ